MFVCKPRLFINFASKNRFYDSGNLQFFCYNLFLVLNFTENRLKKQICRYFQKYLMTPRNIYENRQIKVIGIAKYFNKYYVLKATVHNKIFYTYGYKVLSLLLQNGSYDPLLFLERIIWSVNFLKFALVAI